MSWQANTVLGLLLFTAFLGTLRRTAEQRRREREFWRSVRRDRVALLAGAGWFLYGALTGLLDGWFDHPLNAGLGLAMGVFGSVIIAAVVARVRLRRNTDGDR